MSDDQLPEETGPITGPITGSVTGPVTGPVTQPYTQSQPHAQPQPYAQPHAQPAAQPYPPAYGQVPAYGHGYSQTTLVTPRVGGAHIAIAWIFAVFTLGYFLPWAIAATRQKSNSVLIGLVNFLVGWTVIGWVAALVMACLNDTGPVQINNVAYAVAPVAHQPSATPPAGWYPVATGGQRYWDGVRWTEHTAP